MAEIERRRIEGSDDSNLQEENSQKDWECLEQLFGPIPIRSTEENDNEADNNEASQLWIILLDILLFLGYTGYIGGTGREREYQRKQEQGRRLVNALKETSMSVQECHLIAKGDASSDDDFRGQEGVDRQIGSLDGSGEGDIEMGRMACDQNNDCDARVDIDSDDKSNEDATAKPKQNGLDIDSGDGNKLVTSNMNELSPSVHSSDSETNIKENSKASLSVTDSQANDASLESTTLTNDTSPTSDHPVSPNPETNNSQTISSGNDSHTSAVDVAAPTTVVPPHQHHPSNSQTISSGDDSRPSAVNVAVPTVPPQQYHPSNSSSLYDVDILVGDNKYSALCLHCTHSSLDAAASLQPQYNTATTTTSRKRLVSATCAICLDQYEPGCYVSWSSNKECMHAFHRDCILMWLLKKEELLCPCCRRGFVSESVLNGEVDDENNTGDVGNNAGSDE